MKLMELIFDVVFGGVEKIQRMGELMRILNNVCWVVIGGVGEGEGIIM